MAFFQVHGDRPSTLFALPPSCLFFKPLLNLPRLDSPEVFDQVFASFLGGVSYLEEPITFWIRITLVTESQSPCLKTSHYPAVLTPRLIFNVPSFSQGFLTALTANFLWFTALSVSDPSSKLDGVSVCSINDACATVEPTSTNQIGVCHSTSLKALIGN